MIELIVLDVDGTLTDGKIIYTSSDDKINNIQESKAFDVKDGLAIASWTKKFDKKAAIITGRKSELVKRRAKELGITHLYQGVDNKDDLIEKIIKDEGFTWDQVACIGDDLNDFKMLSKAGISFSVNDAVDDIKDLVDVVCKKDGGCGAVREMIEYILAKDYDGKDLKSLWV
ncbi:MAG: HAD hydrolase family protein [Campylobacterota bacterium]|nr:HAD hydrolase family protein [Campylobacterota bacterium]